MDFGTYWTLSRTHTYSLLLAIPLLVLYDVLIAGSNWIAGGNRGVRNMAELVLQAVLGRLGLGHPFALIAVVIVVAFALVLREQRLHPVALDARVFAAMLLESTLLALLFSLVVGWLTAVALSPFAASGGGAALAAGAQTPSLSLGQKLALALGAGIYEELLFRVILVGGLAWGLGRFGASPPSAVTLATLASAFAFSLSHYLGPLGDPFTVSSFLFRFIAGVAFSAIFVLRGFGIVTWTHALYDVYFLLFLGR